VPTTADSVSLRSPRLYVPIVAVTGLVTALALGFGPLEGTTPLVLLGAAVIATGIPHGAVDHLVAAPLYDLSFTWADQAKFYGAYLGLMGLYGALWPVVPAWCLGFFLVMTMYHFGQADLAYWHLPPVPARLLYLSRGLFLIGLPVVAFPDVVAPIFEAIGGVDVLDWGVATSYQTTALFGLVGQHALLAAGGALYYGVPTWKAGREGLNVVVLAPLFLWVHPLAAFAVYFGLWHSLGHILELLRFFRAQGRSMGIGGFYRKAALFTVLSFVLLGALYAGLRAIGDRLEMIALLFILIAVMTLPHMIIVERLYQKREQRQGVAAG
jgi:Brp/Blh family beta-carotene 15,15'-monooxygenase